MNDFWNNLLSMIDEAGTGLEEFILTPPGKLRLSKIPKATFYSALARMTKKGLVESKQNGKSKLFFITPKGKRLLYKPIQKKRRPDDLSTIVIFDIPENKARERTILRRYLKRNGYTNLQKSVLISPWVIPKDFKELLEELKLVNYVSIIEGRIRSHF